MASNQLPPSFYPPDTGCFVDWTIFGTFWETFAENNCSVTSNMVDFLNLTGPGVWPYVQAYYLNPPGDDDCPFGFCPNPDIAGPLVRIANYITGFCLTVLIFYSSECIEHAFWSQMLITYSLLLTCGISLLQGQLTRFHSIIVISIVCSPVNVYFTGYAIRAFWSKHRPYAVFGSGKEQYIRRAMVLFSVAVWIAILVYAYLPQSLTKFAQDSCRGSTFAEDFFLGTPFFFAGVSAKAGPGGIASLSIFLAIPILVALGWAVAIFRRRDEIWPQPRSCEANFCTVWRTIVTNYPFLQFWTVIVIPTGYWVMFIEFGVAYGNDSGRFSLTFGQVLAVFATITPIIEVVRLAPKLWRWAIGLIIKWLINRKCGDRKSSGHV